LEILAGSKVNRGIKDTLVLGISSTAPFSAITIRKKATKWDGFFFLLE